MRLCLFRDVLKWWHTVWTCFSIYYLTKTHSCFSCSYSVFSPLHDMSIHDHNSFYFLFCWCTFILVEVLFFFLFHFKNVFLFCALCKYFFRVFIQEWECRVIEWVNIYLSQIKLFSRVDVTILLSTVGHNKSFVSSSRFWAWEWPNKVTFWEETGDICMWMDLKE